MRPLISVLLGILFFCSPIRTQDATNPTILALYPHTGSPGDPVWIKGENLAREDMETTVTFGTEEAVIRYTGTRHISATVPDLDVGDYDVVVTLANGDGEVSSNAATFTVVERGAPEIRYLFPRSGSPGDGVHILGKNFSATAAENKVFFGDVPAEVVQASPEHLKVTVPTDEGLGLGAVGITVAVDEKSSAPAEFTIIEAGAPLIEKTRPGSGYAGTFVTIYGENLGQLGGEVTVLFSMEDLTVETSGTTWGRKVYTRVPVDIAAGEYEVAVVVGDQTSNAVPFTVADVPPPVINQISPEAGEEGSLVNIQGENFRGPPLVWGEMNNGMTGATVTFGIEGGEANEAKVLYRSSRRITAIVPDGLLGDEAEVKVLVVVSVGGQDSNPAEFTVTLPPPPLLDSLRPDSGPPGTYVRIYGENLGGYQTEVEVTFDGAPAGDVWTSGSGRMVYARVPSDAGPGPKPVAVLVGGVEAVTGDGEPLVFTVEEAPPPEIKKIWPEGGSPGSRVMIEGVSLGSDPKIFFGEIEATEVWASSCKWHNCGYRSYVQVVVPEDLQPGGVKVKAVVGTEESNEVDFEVVEKKEREDRWGWSR